MPLFTHPAYQRGCRIIHLLGLADDMLESISQFSFALACITYAMCPANLWGSVLTCLYVCHTLVWEGGAPERGGVLLGAGRVAAFAGAHDFPAEVPCSQAAGR